MPYMGATVLDLKYRAQDAWDVTLDYLAVALRVVLLPFTIVYIIVEWAAEWAVAILGVSLDIIEDFVRLYRHFTPRGLTGGSVISGGLGVSLFWFFGPNNLTIGMVPLAILVLVFSVLFGLFTIPAGIVGTYRYFSGNQVAGTENEVTFWQVGFSLFMVYAGFSAGYYLPWLFGMTHL